MSEGTRERMATNTYDRINDYLFILEKQVCFVNDCIDAIKKMNATIQKMNAQTKKFSDDNYEQNEDILSNDDQIMRVSYAPTIYLALHGEVIITTAKILEDTRKKNNSISAKSLRNVLENNLDKISEEYQKEQYSIYCKEHNITDLVRQVHPEMTFRPISESIKLFDCVWGETSDIRSRIKTQRDKIYAHYDADCRNDEKLEKLRKAYSLDYSEVECLLQAMHEFFRHVSMVIGRTPMGDRSL